MSHWLFATIANTHVGPLVDNPVTASAASVPTPEVRFWTNPAPNFSSSVGEAGGEVRFLLGDQRRELLEQLPRLPGRNGARERIGGKYSAARRSRRPPATTPFPSVAPGT